MLLLIFSETKQKTMIIFINDLNGMEFYEI